MRYLPAVNLTLAPRLHRPARPTTTTEDTTMTTTCEHAVEVPGPHPGCAEFTGPESIDCTRPAVRWVVLDSSAGPEGVRLCERHAAEALAGSLGTLLEVGPQGGCLHPDEQLMVTAGSGRLGVPAARRVLCTGCGWDLGPATPHDLEQ